MRPVCQKGIGYQNCYLIGSVNPETGEHVGFISEVCNTDVMNIHLSDLSIAVGEDRHALVITDGAAWHRSKKLIVPYNITLIHLPPYTPEFNPIERLWLWLKEKYLSNIVLNTRDEIFAPIENAWKKITNKVITNVCCADEIINF
jgi:transposase